MIIDYIGLKLAVLPLPDLRHHEPAIALMILVRTIRRTWDSSLGTGGLVMALWGPMPFATEFIDGLFPKSACW